MLFSSLTFIYGFLPVFLILYFAIKNDTYRRVILLAASLFFYAWGEPIYVFFLLGSAALNHLAARSISTAGAKTSRARKVMALAVSLDVIVLIIFKYEAYIAGIVGHGIPKLPMPIGISFFTFQTISYVVDVYRGDVGAKNSAGDFFLYIFLFPQLTAGPIVRYKEIRSQLQSRSVRPVEINYGFYRFAVGLGKKVIIANNCGAAASALFARNGDVAWLAKFMGVVFFSLQLYHDFSGYSDMAIGIGHLIGFTFPENFKYPFAAKSATDFWRRWHISLGTFYRDYIYIPLGGNRSRHIRNIAIVWLLTGMWHGASPNFLLWGAYYGLLVIAEKYVIFPATSRLRAVPREIIMRIYFFVITVVGMAIFCFDSNFFSNMGYLFGIGVTHMTDVFVNSIIRQNAVLLVVAIVCSLPVIPAIDRFIVKNSTKKTAYVIITVARTVQIVVLIAVSSVMLVGSSYNPFLYYRF